MPGRGGLNEKGIAAIIRAHQYMKLEKRALRSLFKFPEKEVVKASPLFFAILFKPTAAVLLLAALALPLCVRAQEAGGQTVSEAEVARRSLSRARALAAVGNLSAAAVELEALRASTRDDSLREVSRLLLVSVYVELPDYVRATALLDESFRERAAGRTGDSQAQAYFALAGQTVNSVRQHLDRYRAYGLNVADADLPAEAGGDLEQLRRLLEKLVEQAKVVGSERTGGTEATALLEDAATVRLRIARDAQDRARWQGEVSDARQQLFAAETRIASISAIPPARRAPAGQAANTAPADGSAPSQRPAATPADSRPEQARQQSAQSASTPPASPPASATAQPSGGPKQEGAQAALHSVGSLAALARQRVAPVYPQIARAARVSGSVMVYLVVNERGEVETVQRADGPVQLQQAAVEAARRWKFNPTVIDGQPVRVSGYLNFNFTL
jgi:TonB family protein